MCNHNQSRQEKRSPQSTDSFRRGYQSLTISAKGTSWVASDYSNTWIDCANQLRNTRSADTGIRRNKQNFANPAGRCPLTSIRPHLDHV